MVEPGDLSDAALVLVGHGSTLNGESSAPTYQHAAALRRSGVFAQVLEAFWKLEPSVAGVLRGVFVRRVFVVPMFISAGYFTEEVIPRELGLRRGGECGWSRVRVRGGMEVRYTHPVGSHDLMTRVILNRAREVVEANPFPRVPVFAETTLCLVGHGTSQSDGSRASIERQVERIRAMQVYGEVLGVFMEESPLVAEVYELASHRAVVVVPFFMSEGLHSREDIPVLLGESPGVVAERIRRGQESWRNPAERRGCRVWYARGVGSEPALAQVILERVREAAEWSLPEPVPGPPAASGVS